MSMEITIPSLEHIADAAREFIDAIGDRRVFAFYGSMGAGKTTFIKAVCEALGVKEQVTSPTFAIVNEYTADATAAANSQLSPLTSHSSLAIYHFDFYRIKRLEEAYDMGCEEYLYSGNLCFIEWPELIEELLPEDTVRVTIAQQPDGQRLITFI